MRDQKKVDDLLDSGHIEIKTNDPELNRRVKNDLYHMAANPIGEEILDGSYRQRPFVQTIEPKRGALPANSGSCRCRTRL